MADVNVLQDEVERILRKLTLVETRAVADHLQVAGLEETAAKRDVLRSIQDMFDGAAGDDVARDALLRGLPVPEQYRAEYQRLLDPPALDNFGQQDVALDAHLNGNDPVQAIADQVVPVNGLQVAPQNNGGQVPQQNLGVGVLNNGDQVAQQNAVGVIPVNGLQGNVQAAPQGLIHVNGAPVLQQNFGASFCIQSFFCKVR